MLFGKMLVCLFQSLFLWNALVESLFLPIPKPLFVSILVFMECARRGAPGCDCDGVPQVSILVFMECARRGVYPFPVMGR